jgi:hypothetical protein
MREDESTLGAMSRSTGSAPAVGTAMAIGLVPSLRSTPPWGWTREDEAENTKPTMPARAMRSV